VEEWTTVYEDDIRKIQAREDERRAIYLSTGETIIEYKFKVRKQVTENRLRVLEPIPA